MERFITLQKREQLTKELGDTIQMILRAGKKEAAIRAINEKRVIVQSRYRTIHSRGSIKEGIMPIVLNDSVLIPLLFLHKQEGLEIVDNEKIKVTYLDEFRERCITTLKLIPQGILDHQFNQPSTEILHKISGRFGELLPILGINPMLGRTYKDFLSFMESPKQVQP